MFFFSFYCLYFFYFDSKRSLKGFKSLRKAKCSDTFGDLNHDDTQRANSGCHFASALASVLVRNKVRIPTMSKTKRTMLIDFHFFSKIFASGPIANVFHI